MPSLPISKREGKNETLQQRIMPNITYVQRKTKMGHDEILNLSYPIFLSYLVENHILDLQESEEGREYLAQIERLKVTTPDISGLRKLSGYKQKVGG